MSLILYAMLILIVYPSLSYAELYQYIDKNGATAFTDNINNIPPDQRPKVNKKKGSPGKKNKQKAVITRGIQEETEVKSKKKSKQSKKIMELDKTRGRKKVQKVIITEYSSFSCGWCNRVRSTLNQIKEKYPESVEIVYKHYDRGGIDSKAGQAAECASDQGKFWEMHDILFDRGPWGNLNKYAGDIGLNTKKFNQCLVSEKYASKIKKDTSEGISLGIRGTPGFNINGKLVMGAQPFSVFDKIIKGELNK